MRTFCETLHPATVAESLADDFSVEDVWRFLDTRRIANQAAIFVVFPAGVASARWWTAPAGSTWPG